MMKCDICLNARVILSENGHHPSCCLDEGEAVDCLTGKNSFFVKRPDKGDIERGDSNDSKTIDSQIKQDA